MATYNGRYARVTVSADTTEVLVSEIGNWTLDLSADEIDTTAFGNDWGKSDVAMKKYTGTLTGFYDPKDTTGQGVIEAAFESGALIADLQIYLAYSEVEGEDLIFWEPDSATDANAGARITSQKFGQDKAGVGTYSVTFVGSGPIKKNVGVVPAP